MVVVIGVAGVVIAIGVVVVVVIVVVGLRGDCGRCKLRVCTSSLHVQSEFSDTGTKEE